MDNEAKPVLHYPFLSNINDNNISSANSLIEEEFNNDNIDYMANIFYLHKQDIEKHSYVPPKNHFMISPHLKNTMTVMN